MCRGAEVLRRKGAEGIHFISHSCSPAPLHHFTLVILIGGKLNAI